MELFLCHVGKEGVISVAEERKVTEKNVVGSGVLKESTADNFAKSECRKESVGENPVKSGCGKESVVENPVKSRQEKGSVGENPVKSGREKGSTAVEPPENRQGRESTAVNPLENVYRKEKTAVNPVKSRQEKDKTTVNRQATEKENQGLHNSRYRDSSGKIIFEDSILCAQFLRDYVDIPMLKDVQPEDIEDVTERFVHMFVEERNSDVVKKVHLKNNSFYLISLIEHKSDVDYNVVMQVFRYIAFIWEDYENEQEKMHAGISRTKNFRYPPILPIVFYDGIENWTASTSLHERVLFSNILGKYIPDYQCMLIQLKEYSSEELIKKKDELSLLMMFDKLRNISDYRELREELGETFLREVIKESPEYLLKLISQIIRMFLAKVNVPREEAEAFTEQIRGRKMGELFKYFEGWDIQAVRREAKEEIEKAKKKAKEEAKKEANKKANEEIEKVREADIQKYLKGIKKYHASREEAITELMVEYELSKENAVKKVAMYW